MKTPDTNLILFFGSCTIGLVLMACRVDDRAFVAKRDFKHSRSAVLTNQFDTKSFDVRGSARINPDGTITEPAGAERPAVIRAVLPIEQPRKDPGDDTLTERVRTGLARDRQFEEVLTHVKIRAVQGVVTVSGTVSSTAEKDRVGEGISHINGVRELKNEIEVVTAPVK